MRRVSSLKSLSLKVVADFVWDALTIRSPALELILGRKIMFSNVDLDTSSFEMGPHNLEITFQQLIEYLSLPTSLKLELSHVLSRQYKYRYFNLFQLLLMIELGFHDLDDYHCIHLSRNLRLLHFLKFGKKNTRELFLNNWMYEISARSGFTSIQTQEFLLTSFPYLQELSVIDCNACTLCLVTKYCPHLKRLNAAYSLGLTDEGIEVLWSPQSVTKQLMYLSVKKTNVTPRGVEIALKHLARLGSLECSNHMDTIVLIKSLSEQELAFVRYKEMSITFTDETEKIYKCRDLIPKLAPIFPNLCDLTIDAQVSIETECLLSLLSSSKISKLKLDLQINASISLFPCDNSWHQINFYPQMNNLTKLSLDSEKECKVCIHSLLNSTPCLQYLTIKHEIYSGCSHSHKEAMAINSSVSHLALVLLTNNDGMVEKCLGLCPSIRTLLLVLVDEEVQFKISGENLVNLTHLSLDYLQMETAVFLVRNCPNLKLLNLIQQSPESEEAMWFQRRSPFVKVISYDDFEYEADCWHRYAVFSLCCLFEAYESNI